MIAWIKKYLSLSKTDKKLFFEALSLSYRIWISHFFYKYERLEKKYQNTGTNKKTSDAPEKIKLAIRRSSKLTFWKNQCLIQSFVARRMLNKRNILSKAYLGVIKNEGTDFYAHAWVEVEDFEVVAKTPNCAQIHEF